MDSTGAISAAVSSLSAGGNAAAISVAVLRQTETAQAQQIATLFSSLGLGNSVNAFG
jgi:hypothetical protein